ncbi:MAG: DNA-formamidopyrimidine glycosylase [Thermostichales cyanobacterium SRBZ-1_bins_19]
MPELPEVETVCRDLNQVLPGQQIRSVLILRPQTVAYPDPGGFVRGLVGRRFCLWRRRGKYLLASLDDGSCLGVHLRMTGQLLWLVADEPLSAHTRLRWLCEGGECRFVDQRTFGQVWWVPGGQQPEQVISGLGSLGPEPFDPQFSPAYLQERLQRSRRPIKSALLDQTLVAGIGNIYADESLFLSGIHPLTPALHLSLGELETLHRVIGEVLRAGIRERGTTFSNYRDLQGVNGNYQGQAWVYDRAGDPCRVCGTGIVRIKIGGRSAHFCPTCQAQRDRV